MPHRLLPLLAASLLALGAAEPAPIALSNGDKPFVFGFGSWDKAPQFAVGPDGVRITTPNSQGGGGLPASGVQATVLDWTPALTLRVEAGNKAKGLALVLQDGDETKIKFSFNLAKLTPGAVATISAEDGASLAEPASTENAGSVPGFDPATAQWAMLIGTWSADPIDLTVSRVSLVPPTPEMLTARKALNERRTREAENARRQQEAAAQAARDLLEKGSPHPADGPEPTFICAVAPDVLAITVQACRQGFNRLLPYTAQAGDEIKDEKDVFHEVQDDGVQERHLRALWRNGARIGLLSPDGTQVAIESASTGQVLDERGVDLPQAYAITSETDAAYAKPVAPTAVFRKGKPNGRSRPLPFLYTIALRLPTPLKEGAAYSVRFHGVNTSKESIGYTHQPRQARSLAIHSLQTGYRPDDPFKRAYCSFWMGVDKDGKHGSCTPAVGAFELLDARTGKTVFTGKAEQARDVAATDRLNVHEEGDYTKAAVYRLDFSSFTTPGDYLVHVPGLGVSYPLRLAKDAWEGPFKAAMQGILAQRQGIDLGPPALAFTRKRTFHPDDGVRFYQLSITSAGGQEAGEGGQAGRGGNLIALSKAGKLTRTSIVPGAYQDAGDWDTLGHHLSATYDLLGLYLLNAAAVKRTRLSLPAAEMANSLPDILDEAMWQMPTWKSLQTPEGGVRGGYGYGWGCPPGQTSSMLTSAGVYAVDYVTTLSYAADAARAARVLADFDKAKAAEWLASARKAWDWTEANAKPGNALWDESLKSTGWPPFKDAFANARAQAAVELLAATREPAFDAAFKQNTELTTPGLYLSQTGASFAYARLPDGLGDAALKQAAVARITAYADHAAEYSRKNPFDIVAGKRTDLPLIGPCTWFSVPAQGGLLPIYAYELSRKPEYLRLAVQGANYSLGANPDNFSYCTGVGANWQRLPFMVDCHVSGQGPDVPLGHIPFGQGNEGGKMSTGMNGWVQQWFLNFGPTKKMLPNWYDWPATEAYIDFSVYPMNNENCFNATNVPAACYWFWLANRE